MGAADGACVFSSAFIGQFGAPVSRLMLLLLITDQRGELDFVLLAGRVQPIRTESLNGLRRLPGHPRGPVQEMRRARSVLRSHPNQ